MLTTILVTTGLLVVNMSNDFITEVKDSLKAVKITAEKGVVVSRKDTILTANSFSISEALQHNPSLSIGDYGAYSGLKTISLKGLGSAQTAIYIDGIRVNNLQSGQSDLALIGTELFDSVIIDHAQNSLSFVTTRPVFQKNKYAGKVNIATGSFGTYTTSARMDFKLSDSMAITVNAAGLLSDGDFPYGEDKTRINNDIKQIRIGVDLFGIMKGGDYHVKAYFSDAERGTPGSIYYLSEDRQEDMNTYLQTVLRKRYSRRYANITSAKLGYDKLGYISSYGDTDYVQLDMQLNSSHEFTINDWWEISLASDLQWTKLNSDIYKASRLTSLNAVTSSFDYEGLSADIGLEYNSSHDKDAAKTNVFSPSINIKYTVLPGLIVSTFGRRGYRVPTFNELYYVNFGNPDLKHEDAWLSDFAIDYYGKIDENWNIKTRLDAFYNELKNKITSAPSESDPNLWRPYNIGLVRSMGIDAEAGFGFKNKDWAYNFDAKYCMLSATDRTKDSSSFGEQIPFVAKHTIVVSNEISWKGWMLDADWQMRSGRTDNSGPISDWDTLNIALVKTLSFEDIGDLQLKLSGLNITDNRYEVVAGYPMQGRSVMAGLGFKF